MSLRKPQTGFSAFELVIAIAVVAIVAIAGYAVYNRQNNKTASTQLAKTSTASNVPSAPTIDVASDLDKASATLDQVDPGTSNDSDSSQLDSQLANF